MKKYLAFYKLYKDKHPEFDIEFNKRDNKDKDDNDDKGSE